VRADDFLLLNFEFINLQVSTPNPGSPVLTIVDPAKPAFIYVNFPAQSTAEQAFWLAADGPGRVFHVPPGQPAEPGASEPPMSPAGSVIPAGGGSRLVFAVPANAGPIPYSLPILLEKCSQFPLSIAPTAVTPPRILPILNIRLAAAEAVRAAVATTAVGSAAAAPNPVAGQLAALMVRHRATLRAGLSLAFKVVGSRPAVSNVPRVASARPPLIWPDSSQTAIGMPYRLIISPDQYGAWAHASTPVSSPAGRTELWHTRLGLRPDAGEPIYESAAAQYRQRFSAIWANDLDHPDPTPFRTSLNASDRENIVHQSYAHPDADMIASRMMLTTLGGWLDARANWDDRDSTLTIKEWRHLATMGRDHYGRIVYPGFLFPFGHRASLCKITERIFHPSLPGNPAYLRQRVFVVVRDQDKFYPPNAPSLTDATSGSRLDLQMPFQRVRITTMATPNLDSPPANNESCFCPQVGAADFKFHLIAEDLDGNEIEFSAPLYFVDDSSSGDAGPAVLQDLIKNYPTPRGVCDFQGRRVPFAEGSDPNKPSDVKPGSTSFETASVTFAATQLADPRTAALDWECHFYPKVTAANIVVPALKHLAGKSGPIQVTYEPGYLKNGFDPNQNKGQVFLRMADPSDPGGKISFSQQADRSGGLATPNMQMTHLSRLLGPVSGDAAKMSGGNFDPKDFFAALESTLDKALLFGTIPLTEVLSPVGLDDPRNLPQLPRFVTEAMTKLDGLIQDAAAAQDLVNKVSQEAANLGGQAGLISADAAAVAKDLDALTTDLQGLANDPTSAAQGFVSHLETFVGDLQKLLNDLPALDAVADAKRMLQQILSRLQQEVAAADSIVGTLLAEQLTIKFVWNPAIQSWPTGDPLFVPSTQDPDSFKISVEMQVAKTAAEPAMDIYCGLRDFQLRLLPPPLIPVGPFVTLHFDILEFTLSTGKSPDVNVKLKPPPDGIRFDGCLQFVNTLEKLIPFDGFSDPPALSVTPQGITAGYSVGPLTVPIGIFVLHNVSLGASFKVPFVVDPLELDFNFCTPEQPFLLTVAALGGGGYFKILATSRGLNVEGALGFGAAVSFNNGVASGGVQVMAGITFATDSAGNVNLAGFLRMGGIVSVLGLVSMSIELDMELQYFPDTNSVIGEATITVEVNVLFFSEAVSISCQKEFAGPPRSPQPAHTQAMMAARPAVLAAPPGATAPMPRAATAPPPPPPGGGATMPGAATAPPPPTFGDLMQPDGTRVPWRDYCRAFV
jgi:hypothetical protein